MTLPLHGTIPDEKYDGPKLLKKGILIVHFSPVVKIADRTAAGIANFQEAIRSVYPNLVLDIEQVIQFEIEPSSTLRPAIHEVPVWRMADAENLWRVSLTQETIALEVSGDGYLNSTDYSARMAWLVDRVAQDFSPFEFKRIGVRLVNAEAAGGSGDPRRVCRPALVSVSGEDGLEEANLFWRFAVDEGMLILRSGLTPKGNTHDPQILEFASESRWYLDIDVINQEAGPFEVATIRQSIKDQVRRVHAIYRWAMPCHVLEGQDL